MRRITLFSCSLAALISAQGCKPVSSESSSELNAEAAAVAKGEEVMLSGESIPPPKPSAKLTPEDLDPSRHNLSNSFSRLEIGENQIAGSDLTGTPRDLQGIWWMDGNPVADETISFAFLDVSEEKPLFPVFGANNFSFHSGNVATSDFPRGDRDYKEGNQIFTLAAAATLTYEMHFTGSGDNKYQSARIVPAFKIKLGPLERWLRLSRKIMEFTMTKKGPHLYARDNTLFGRPIPGYDFRRILVPSASNPKILEKTEWWADYAKQPGPLLLSLSAKKN